MGFFILELSSVWQSTWLISSLSWVQILQFQLLSYSIVGNKLKDVKIILLINKTEAFAMRKLVGNENVKQTYSGHAKYYLVESYQNLKALSDYRKSKIVG